MERLQARQSQRGAIRQPVDEPCQIRGFRKLREDAMAQARTTQSINPLSLQRVIKKLPNKASGPDSISYDFLRQLPFEAVAQLADLLNQMEKEALLPTQLRMVNIVMIPKNCKVETPIALTSCLYRLWNRVRKHDIVSWQLSLDAAMPWDHARPKKDCLPIAVGRMMHSELCKHNGIHTVTCLADLSCFYDTVTLDILFCISSLHLIFTEVQATQRSGSTASSRAFADMGGRCVLRQGQGLRPNLTQAGLRLNPDKTGFITSSKETAQALKGLLQPGDPAHHDVLRDIGVDATAARRRRVTQVRKRFTEGRARAGIAHRPKLTTSV